MEVSFKMVLFVRFFNLRMMILPRLARDKHRESTQKRVHRFLADIGEDEKAAQYFLKSYEGLGKSTTRNGVLCFRLPFLFELQL